MIKGLVWINKKTQFLYFLLALSAICSCLLYFHFSFTGYFRIDGIIGIILGIYVCAHPAANLADIVLYGRDLGVSNLPKALMIYWWFINALAMFSGLLVFVLGLLRYSDIS